MPEPTPPTTPAPQKSGWTPTTSTTVGAMLGGAVGQIVVKIVGAIIGHELDLQTAGAINTVCVFLVGYLIPDGGRK